MFPDVKVKYRIKAEQENENKDPLNGPNCNLAMCFKMASVFHDAQGKQKAAK